MKYKLTLHKSKRILIAGFVSIFALGLGAVSINSRLQAAGNASLSMTPGTIVIQQGSNFTVDVYEDSGSQPVNAVQITISYDQSKLQALAPNASGAFTSCEPPTHGGGRAQISCSRLGDSLTGRQLVGKFTFKALASSGSAAINYLIINNSADSTSIITSNGNTDIWNQNTSGASVSFTSAPAPSNPTTPTPSNPTTPTRPSSNAGGSSGGSSNSGGSSSNSNSGNANSGSNNSGGGSQALPNGNLSAGVDDQGAPIETDGGGDADAVPQIVSLKIVDKEGRPVEGVEVRLNKQRDTTDANGIVSFVNVPPGRHKVEASSVLGSATMEILVKSDSGETALPQSFEVTLKKGLGLAFFGSVAGGLVVVGILVWLIIRWRNNRPLRPRGGSSPKSQVFINGMGSSGGTDPALSMSSMMTPMSGPPAARVTPTPASPPPVQPPNQSVATVIVPGTANSGTVQRTESKADSTKVAGPAPVQQKASAVPTAPVGGQVITPTQPASDPIE